MFSCLIGNEEERHYLSYRSIAYIVVIISRTMTRANCARTIVCALICSSDEIRFNDSGAKSSKQFALPRPSLSFAHFTSPFALFSPLLAIIFCPDVSHGARSRADFTASVRNVGVIWFIIATGGREGVRAVYGNDLLARDCALHAGRALEKVTQVLYPFTAAMALTLLNYDRVFTLFRGDTITEIIYTPIAIFS